MPRRTDKYGFVLWVDEQSHLCCCGWTWWTRRQPGGAGAGGFRTGSRRRRPGLCHLARSSCPMRWHLEDAIPPPADPELAPDLAAGWIQGALSGQAPAGQHQPAGDIDAVRTAWWISPSMSPGSIPKRAVRQQGDPPGNPSLVNFVPAGRRGDHRGRSPTGTAKRIAGVGAAAQPATRRFSGVACGRAGLRDDVLGSGKSIAFVWGHLAR